MQEVFVDNLPHQYYAVDSYTNLFIKTPNAKEVLDKMKEIKY